MTVNHLNKKLDMFSPSLYLTEIGMSNLIRIMLTLFVLTLTARSDSNRVKFQNHPRFVNQLNIFVKVSFILIILNTGDTSNLRGVVA